MIQCCLAPSYILYRWWYVDTLFIYITFTDNTHFCQRRAWEAPSTHIIGAHLHLQLTHQRIRPIWSHGNGSLASRVSWSWPGHLHCQKRGCLVFAKIHERIGSCWHVDPYNDTETFIGGDCAGWLRQATNTMFAPHCPPACHHPQRMILAVSSLFAVTWQNHGFHAELRCLIVFKIPN